MSVSIPDSSLPWDRVLPRPVASLHDLMSRGFPSRSGSLLQHHITSDRSTREHSDDAAARRSTVPSIAYQEPAWTFQRDGRPLGEPDYVRLVDGSEGVVTRKRAASHMDGDRREPSPLSPSPHEASAGKLCLCRPESKIPRPRTGLDEGSLSHPSHCAYLPTDCMTLAFILYRQHHQRQHPGVGNPDISKILGEQWRNLSDENKKTWQALAEEEKARHQQQYPDYRYQPRRNNRHGQKSISEPSSAVTIPASATCNKCGGKTMHPPSTPAAPWSPTTPAMPPAAFGAQPVRRSCTVNGGPPMGRQLPPGMVSPPQAGRVRPFAEVFATDPRVRYGTMPPTPGTPESAKRRRFNGNAVYVANRGEVAEGPYTPYSPRRVSLPRPDLAQHPRQMIVGPPPQRQQYQQPRQSVAHPAQNGKIDPSLVLPPLKTNPTSPGQKAGVEAMIKSIPVTNKIKILTQASPQLPMPGPASPPHSVRGAIIAIEGLDPTAVGTMANYLTDELSKAPKFTVKTFTGPDVSSETGDDELSQERVFQTFATWRKTSQEMASYITTLPDNKTSAEADEEMPEAASATSPRTIIPATEKLSIDESSIPIAIVPRYQLTTVDASAISMPIMDAYSPLDHWRWLAALWRGCVGPDVTVVVQGVGEEGDQAGVEVRLAEWRTVVVRLGNSKEGTVEERWLRRVGFEVEEFLRK